MVSDVERLHEYMWLLYSIQSAVLKDKFEVLYLLLHYICLLALVRFILLFGGPSRKGLRTFIFKNHTICLIWCVVAAFLYTLLTATE